MSVPREWTDDQLRALFPALGVEPPAPVSCTDAVAGQGTYLNHGDNQSRGCARIDIEIEPADALSVRFEHEWPADCDAAQTGPLDAATLEGIVDAIVHGRPALRFGRVVTRSIVHYEGLVTPIAFSIAAAMAMQDAARRAGWDPEPPTDDRIATFGRLCG
jgi:hypothetical protein